MTTDLPSVDLSPFAGVLAATRHGDEIEQLRVEAVTLAQVGGICGNSLAVACYAPEDPENSFAGHMWFAVDDARALHGSALQDDHADALHLS